MLNMHNCNARMLKNEIAIHYMKCKSCILHLLPKNEMVLHNAGQRRNHMEISRNTQGIKSILHTEDV